MLYVYRQKATVRTLEDAERRRRHEGRDDHHARAFDIIQDVQRPHDMTMEVSVILPNGMTKEQQEACNEVLDRAWTDMFYAVLRATDTRTPTPTKA